MPGTAQPQLVMFKSTNCWSMSAFPYLPEIIYPDNIEGDIKYWGGQHDESGSICCLGKLIGQPQLNTGATKECSKGGFGQKWNFPLAFLKI